MIPALVVIVIAVAVGLAVAWPVIAAGRGTFTPITQVSDPEGEALDRSLDAIREIEFDHATGHLSDDDFAQLDAEERARALAIMRRRDAARDGADDPPASGDGTEAGAG